MSTRADHAAVLRLLAKRNMQLGSARNRAACRLHALLVELVPGGIAKEITANRAAALLGERDTGQSGRSDPPQLALEHLDDLRRIDDQMRASKRRIADAVKAAGTHVTEIFGVGPVVAAIAVGHTGDVRRFANRDRFAAYNGTAPIEVVSGGRHRAPAVAAREPPMNHAIHIAAITQIRHAHYPAAPTTTASSPKARPRRKRSAR